MSAQDYTEHQVAELAKRAITPEMAEAAGVLSIHNHAQLPEGCPDYWTINQDDDGRAYLPGLLFTWRSPITGAVEHQLRPDKPPVDDTGRTRKYVFRKDAPSILHAARPVDVPELVLITEGTCQTLAAGHYAPDKVAVYGIAGCQSWMKRGVPGADLEVVDGRDVIVILDSDAAINRDVFEAGTKLAAALRAEGAASVRFMRVPGGQKSGLDDVLGERREERRFSVLANLIQDTQALTEGRAKKPADSRPDAKAEPEQESTSAPWARFFDHESGALLVQTLSEAIRAQYPAALTAENKVAVYRGGVYGIDGTAFLSAVTGLLGERFIQGHHGNAEAFTIGTLAAEGTRLPERSTKPILNVLNGMLDLRTGQLHPHAPGYLSSSQFPVVWHPDATCPTYEAWLPSVAGIEQIDDLEESTSLMLDPSTTPTKAVFLFGEARSGKSTFLRLMQAMAGTANRSAVSLHQLSENRFMAANVFGKVLNTSADLKATHLEDISLFKMMTGEDSIQADRKFGGQFAFTNRALFAFSANKLPTVGEDSAAYTERVRPFQFPFSFAGHEDPTMEARMLAEELPGILVRWVRAWQRRTARGEALDTTPAVRAKFEQASDKVRQFVAECCRITEVVPGKGWAATPITVLYQTFRDWTAEDGRVAMSRSRMRDRLEGIQGVRHLQDTKGVRGYNLRVLPAAEWGLSSGVDDLGKGGLTRPQDRPAVPAVSDHPPQDVEETFSRPAVEEIVSPSSEGGAPELPELPGSHAVTGNPLDAMLESWAVRYESTCDLGHAEVLVGGLWFACPVCHPKTVERAA